MSPRTLQAAQDLAHGESRYRELVEGASDGIVLCDLDGNYVEANSRALEIFGYGLGEFRRLNVRDLVPEDELERQPLQLAALAAGRALMFERVMRRRDGSRITVEISAKRVGDHIQGFYRDVTARKAAENDLRHAHALLAATLDSTADGILVVDREGRVLLHNRKFLDLWGVTEAMIAADRDALALAYTRRLLRDPAGYLERIRELERDLEAESFDVLELQNGRVLERYSKPYRLSGASVGRVWSFRDVSARRRAEEALRRSEEHLRQAQKMEAIGQLAGGIAHDFNNLLTAILGNNSLLLAELPAETPLRECAEEIERASERAATLVRQLLASSRKQVLELQTLDLNEVVETMHTMLRRIIGEHIDLVTHTARPLGLVRADRGQLELVVLNLAVNARDAMPDGGTLVLETAEVEVEEALDRDGEPLPAGPAVMLAVRDTGAGMTDEVRQRVFEPFFTTKPRGQGTGLGLSTVYGIVRQCGGRIEVESAPGRGAAFRILLPRLEARVHAEPPVAAPAVPGGTGETVLLVEDEPLVRDFLAAGLATHGYRVLEAANGEEALRLAAAHDDVDLLMTDVVMPGMNGRQLAERLVASRPGLPVLYVSGYADDLIGRHGVQGPGVDLLQKPFTLDALARKVRRALDAPRRARAA